MRADLFDGDFVSVQFRPFEADAEGTALEDYLHWMEETGAEPTELAMAGWINATLAFDGLLAAGPEFDRDKVLAATNSITDFTAGGLIETVDWTQAHTPFTNDTRPDDDDASSAPRQCRSWTASSRPWPRPTSRGCASRLASSGRSPSPPTSADRDT